MSNSFIQHRRFPCGYSLTFLTRPPSTSLSICATANSSTCCIIPSGADWQQWSLAAATLAQLLQFWDEGGRDYWDRFTLYHPILPLSSPSLHHFIHSICRCHAMSEIFFNKYPVHMRRVFFKKKASSDPFIKKKYRTIKSMPKHWQVTS